MQQKDKSGGLTKVLFINKSQLPWMKHMVLLAGIGVLLIISAGLFTGTPKPPAITDREQQIGQQVQKNDFSQLEGTERALEEKLTEVLAEVAGAGKVTVKVTLAEGPETVYAMNTVADEKKTEEKDQSGGTRVITERNENQQVVFSKQVQSGTDKPVVLKEIRPQIAGVVVVAEGGSQAEVREKLTRAVQTLLKIPSHQVMVLPKEGK